MREQTEAVVAIMKDRHRLQIENERLKGLLGEALSYLNQESYSQRAAGVMTKIQEALAAERYRDEERKL